jgi:hypothetical protein
MLESFEWHHAGTNPDNCRLVFHVLRRPNQPEVEGYGWWHADWKSAPITIEETGSNSTYGVTNSGTIAWPIQSGNWYLTAFEIRDCDDDGELLYPVQKVTAGSTDVGAGDSVGFGYGDLELEENGSVSGIKYRDEWTTVYYTTLHISGL